MAMPGPLPGPGRPPVQRVQPQAYGGGGGYAPLPPAGRGAAHPRPQQHGLHGIERLFFEPEGEQKHTNWVYVGRGKGQYAQQDYKYVGEGAGDYHKEEVEIPVGRKLRQECLWCVAALCCAVFSTVLLIASSRASSRGPAEEPMVLLPPQLQVTCRDLSLWPDRDPAAAEVVCGNCQALVLKTNFQSCGAYCQSFGQQCFYAAQDKASPDGLHTDGCQVESELECDALQGPPAGDDMICGCKDPGAATADNATAEAELGASGVDDEDVGDRPMTDEERDELCTEDGADCSETMCCKTAGLMCFKKDQYWSECLDACEPGVHDADEPQYRTPWECEDIDHSGQEGSALWNGWHSAAKAVGSAAGATLDAAKHHGSKALDAARHHGSNAMDAASDVVDSAGHHINQAKDATGGLFDIAAGDIWDSVGHHVTNVKNASGDMLDDAGDAVTAAAGYARDTAKHGVQKVKNASGDMLNDAKDAVANAAGDAHDAAKHAAKHAHRLAGAAVNGSRHAGGKVVAAVKGAVRGGAEGWHGGEPGGAAADGAEDAGCARQGENCKGIGCCVDQDFTCFEHADYWAECMPECQPGVHESDAPQFQSPWTCAVLTRDSPGTLPPNYVSTTVPPPADQPAMSAAAGGDNEFHCHVATSTEVSKWSPEQKSWCCENANLGCDLFNCAEGEPAAWSADQKAFCCETAQKGCEADAVAAQAAAVAPEAEAEAAAATGTAAATEAEATPESFNCDAGLHKWKTGWSEEKKEWCCEKKRKGCDAPRVPLAVGDPQSSVLPPILAKGKLNDSATVDAPPMPPAAGGPQLSVLPPILAKGKTNLSAMADAPPVPPAAGGPQPSAPLANGSANGSATVDAPPVPPPLANGSANGSATLDAPPVPPAAGGAPGNATDGTANSIAMGNDAIKVTGEATEPPTETPSAPPSDIPGGEPQTKMLRGAAASAGVSGDHSTK